MIILGISAFYHDSAACLIRDGEIIAAAQEERFTRQKHDASFPINAIKYCINEAGVTPSRVDYVVFYEKPFLKFERLLENYLSYAPRGFKSFTLAMPVWIKSKLFQKKSIIGELENTLGAEISWRDKLLFSEHHLSHAASAFYPSPFNEAAVLTLDGVGEWATSSVAMGLGSELKVLKDIQYPHSLGFLYSSFTYYAGFKVNSGEYKLMGLAPYGEPKYAQLIKSNIIDIAEDGSFHLDMSYFDYAVGLTMTSKKFHDLFGGPPRQPESELTQREMDLAASIQQVTEEIVVKLAKSIAIETGARNLCLAGGVALNCVANGRLVKEKIFDNIWIQPAAGDAGGALGAALAVWHMMLRKERKPSGQRDEMRGSYLGPQYKNEAIEKILSDFGANYDKLDDAELIDRVARHLAEGKAIGWMQGRMEFGPRSLGARSIIADPRSSSMQKQLNLKVKYRESFRPFAPSILSECVSDWFDLSTDSPYMLTTSNIKESKRRKTSDQESSLFGLDRLNVSRSEVPAITHVDYSARIQTVHPDTNPIYHALIKRFYKITGCPIVVNTSFNIRGEPIVCTPTDALRCFMGTELDILVVGNFLLYKDNQNPDLKLDYKSRHALD